MEVCRNQKSFLETQGQMKKINADNLVELRYDLEIKASNAYIKKGISY